MDYPALSLKPDGDSFDVEFDNPAVDGQTTDGGYVVTRPSYTRTPPRTWTFKYSDLSQADHDALESFWSTQAKGSSVAFNWTHPRSGEVVNVRFTLGFKLKLTRIGPGDRYQTSVSLTEV